MHTFQNTTYSKAIEDLASSCNINNFDGIENGGGCLGPFNSEKGLITSSC